MGYFPAIYNAALSARQVSVTLTFEVEGWPTAYSNRPLPSGWYTKTALDTAGGTIAARSAWNVPTTVKQFFKADDQGTPVDFGLSAVALDLLQSRSTMGTAKVSLVDLDGSLAQLTALRRPAGATLLYGIGGADTPPPTSYRIYLAGDTTAVDAAQYIYIGREAFKVLDSGTDGSTGDSYVDVERAVLGSVMVPHQGVFPAASYPSTVAPTGSAGDVVSAFPRHLVDRKVWIRLGYNATCDADCVLAFTGTIRDFGWEDGGRTLTFNCEDAQTRCKRPVFTDLSTRWFPAGGNSTPTIGANPGQTTWSLYGLPASFGFRTNERVFGIIENQPYFFQSAGQTLDSAGHPVPGSYQLVQLDPTWFRASIVDALAASGPAGFRPMILIARGATPGSGDNTDGIWPQTVDGVDASHVLSVLLLVLTSTGTAANMGSPGINGEFDLLPAGWGLGIPAADINIEGIVALALKAPARTVVVPVLDVVPDAREWLLSLMRPFGYALTINAAGQIDVVAMDPLNPDDTAALSPASIGMADVALDSSGQPSTMTGPLCSGEQRVVAVKWSDSPFVRDGKIQLRQSITVQLSEDDDAVALNGSIEPLDVSCPGLYSITPGVDYNSATFASNTGVSFFIAPNGQQGQSLIGSLLQNLALRFGGAPFVLTLEVWLKQSERSIGDWVLLSLPFMPNPFTGARGMSNIVAQVTSRRANLFKGTVELELTVSEANNQPVRFLSPSLVISSWNAGAKQATVVDTYVQPATSFHDTDSLGPLTGNPPVAGTPITGLVVRIYAVGGTASTCGRSGPVVVDGLTSSTVMNLHTAPTITLLDGTTRAPAAGDVIRLGDYGEQIAVARTRYSYLADPTNDLLGGTDPADVWA